MSIQTKEMPTALSNLMKAKGQHKDIVTVQRPSAVIVENQHTEVTATPEQAPDEPVTPVQNPEPVDDGRDSKAYRELKQYHDKSIYEERQKTKQLEEALSQVTKPVIKPPKTPEEMKAFKEQYGEAVDYMRTIVIEELQNGGLQSDLQARLNEVTKTQAELREKEAFKLLLEEHPDADEIRKDPKFAAWFNEQPDDIKRILATSVDPRSISKQLSLYKLEVLGVNPKEKKKAKIQEQVDASLGVDISGRTEIQPQKKTWAISEINRIGADYKLWLKHKDEIDLARRENRVDYSK